MAIDPLELWHKLAAQRDIAGLNELLADDCAFFSPVVHTPQRGKAITKKYLAAAFQVFFNETFRYVREVKSARDAVLEFEVELDGVAVNGVDMLHWNESGQVTEFKVMLRPLKAINIIHQKMGELLTAGGPQ